MDCPLPFLPKEIIIQILKCLPVKSLIRFQTVCKHWKNLIKTPSFIQDHLHISIQRNPSLLVQQNYSYNPIYFYLLDSKMQSLEFVKIPPLSDSWSHIRVVGSCNGLLCLADQIRHRSELSLLNPATKEVRKISLPLKNYRVTSHFGFGFSPIINDYKIIRINVKVDVYSLTTGSWRNIPVDNLKYIDIHDDGVTINGVIFWKGHRRINGRGYVIVSFDIASEVFTLLPWPVSLDLPPNVKLDVYMDKLAIISHPGVINYDDSCICFAVMEDGVMDSSEKRWSLSRKYLNDFYPFNLRAETIWRNEIVCIDYELPRFITESEDEKENANAEQKFGLYLINVGKNERKVHSITKHPGYSVSVFNYVESLVPVGITQM